MKSTITYALLSTLIGVGIALFAGLLWWIAPATTTVLSVAPVLIAGFLLGFGLLFQASPMLRQMLRPLRQVYPDALGKTLRGGLSAMTMAVLGLFVQSIVTPTTASAQCSDFAVIVGEWGNASLHRFDGNTGNYDFQLATGIGARINSVLQFPTPNGDLYLGGSGEVHVVDAFTGVEQFAFTGGPFSGLTEQLVAGLDGSIYVANEGNAAGDGSIARYNATTGAFISTFLTFPTFQPNGLAQDASGNWYIGTRNAPNKVYKYSSAGVFLGEVTTLGTSAVGGGLAVFNNELYVINTNSPQTVEVFSLPINSFPATAVRTLNTGGSAFVGIAFGPDNNLYLADFFNGRVTVFNPTTGALIRTLTNAAIPNPHGVGFTPCAPVVCTTPSGVTLGQTAPTCTGNTANNNGIIQITAGTNVTNFGISTAGAAAYDGPAYPATAFTAFPQTVSNTIPNTGGTYIVRVFNGDATCFVDQMITVAAVTCSGGGGSCANNLLPNGSLEAGTFAPSTVNDENGTPITTTLTTYGGSDAIFLPFSSAPTEGHPITGFKLNTGYWVDATTNGGLGAKDEDRLLVIHSGTGAGRCIWPGGMGFAYTIGTCYRVGFWAAQFDPANMNVASSINFEVENAFGTNIAGGTLANFNVAPSAINNADPNFLQYSFALPASGSTAKKIDGTPYTGTGVVDWTTLNWQYFSFDFTPAIADPPLNLYLSTSAASQGVALDGWCSVECSATCINPSAITLGQTAPTCTGGVANNNGSIQITAGTNITNFGISTEGAAAYDGPAYPATTFTGLPQTVSSTIPNSGGTYIVRMFNGDGTCFTDQTITVLPVCCLEVVATASACHGNGTPENAADDFINFSVTITNPLESAQYFTVTGTQNGNPIAINLSNGSAANAVNCGLKTPLRTPAGTAGQGAITLTVTDNLFGCSKTITIADPGTCAVTCTPGTPTMVMYSYSTQIDITDLVNLPIILPKFDQLGGTRTLTSVKLDYEVGATTIAVMENKAAQAQNFRVDFLTDAEINLNGNLIATPGLMVSLPLTSIGVGINVPAQGAWPGDFTPPLPAPQVPSTTGGMAPWLTDDKLQFGKDPRTDPRWVTNATGDATDDDDMIFFPATTDTDLGSITYTAPGDLANFIGVGTVPLDVSTLSGLSSFGGGGNVDILQRTRAYAYGKVTYTYECAAVTCAMTALTAVPGACDPANNIYEVTGQLTFTNPPTDGELVIRIEGGGSQKFMPPFNSPISYTLGPLNSDMANHTVTAGFSSDPFCTISKDYSAPGMCLSTAPTCAANEIEGFDVYTDVKAISTTNFTHNFTGIPKFNTLGGTRTLKKVLVSFQQTMRVAGVLESTDAQPSELFIETSGTSSLKLAGNPLGDISYNFTGANITVSADIPVPAQGTWPGDVVGSTIAAMSLMISNNLNAGTDPTTDPGWVTTLTGNLTHDDDIAYFPPHFEDETANFVVTTPAQLADFTGVGAVDLVYMAMAASSGQGSGNFNSIIRTKAGATVYVKYIYCEALCTAPTLSTAVTSVGCFGASTGAIDLTVTGGTSPFSYDWDNDGPEMPDNDTEDLSGLAVGTYTVTVTTTGGCSATISATVTQPATAVSVTATSVNSSSCSVPNGSISITAAGGTGAYTYDWADIVGVNDIEDRTGLGAGTYTVTVTDANGCTTSTSRTITAPNAPTVSPAITNVLCFGASTGAIDITAAGGTAPYTYDWADIAGAANAEDRTALAAGMYTVTVTDAASCSVSASYNVTQPASAVAVTVSAFTNILCFNAATGTISITATGGTPGYTYDWADIAGATNVEDRTGLAAGTYTVTVTDANGCTASVSQTLSQPATAVSVTAIPTNVLCFGGSNGAIDITAAGGTGAYTYDWADIAGNTNVEDRTGLTAGTYTVTVTDANNCTATISATVTQPAAAGSVTGSVTNSTNCTAPNGAISITATGGTPAYTYDWNDIAGAINVEDRTGLGAGTYTVTVTDANNCTATNSFTVGAPPSPTFSPNVVANVLCFGESTGAIDVTLAGGVAPYTYDWADVAGLVNTEDRTNIPAGTYTVTATDNAGCTATTSAIITQPAAALSVSLTGVSTTDCVNGTIDISVSGGTGAYTYDWSNDGPETPDNDLQDLVVNAPGTYTVTITDANGCTATLSATYSGCDKGDLVDTYGTTNANSGASHVVITGIKIGATVDAETDGQPSPLADGDGADEDGFVPTAAANMLVAGQTTTINIPVMNMTGVAAKLTMYFDWNNDGDIADANEMYSATVANNATTVALPVAVPSNAVLNTNLGTRIRLTTSATMAPTGFAPDGEVEDYLVQVMGFDYGDLADNGAGTSTGNYNTTTTDNGPSHKIIPTLKLGGSVDADANGQPSGNADGDDSTTAPATDDENGVTLPMFVTGIASNVDFTLMNMTGGSAKLTLFIDWNKDGDFLDAGEMFSTTVANNATTASISVTPPLMAVLNMPLGVRVRLSTDATASMLPTGPAPDGEVEDYVATVMGFDFGDLADSAPGTATAPTGTPANHNTLSTDNGAAHKIVTDPTTGAVTLKIGTTVDDEANGQPSVDAGETTGGDDNTETPDDEELDAYLATKLFIVTQTTNLTIPVMNMTGSDAKLVVYFDFNKDGDFIDAGEMFSTTVANLATSANIAVVVPANAVVGQDLGFRVRLAGATEPMNPTGVAQSGEVEDYMVQVIGYDYGDLPDTYNTNGNDTPPNHIVSIDLKLGASVDAELDGAPEAMAGLMTGGDDADPGLVTFGTSTPAGDDENGVTFVTPMVPGSTACIEVTAMNMAATTAVLQMWVDFNGDGDMLDAGEAITTGNFNGAGSGAVVPATVGLTNARLCFDVPADAVFAPGAAAFVRFRLSPLGGLAPNTQAQPVPFGEIEDYKVQLGKVGNLVFEDYNFNGTQDAGEPGINGVSVTLTWLGANGAIGGGDDITYPVVQTGTGTFQTGEYYFCGLTDGPGATDNNFKITFGTPANMTPTRTNQGNQTNGGVADSDGAITGMDLTMAMETFAFTLPTPTTENGTGDSGAAGVGNFPDNATDETHDQGFAFLDYGDLPESGNGDQFSTNMGNNGAVHVILPGFKLGASVDGERDGAPSADASGDGADEDGVTFTSPLIPGNNATISVVSMNPTGAAAVLQGWIDWNNNGLLDAAEALAFTSSVIPTGNATTTFTFPVPATAVFNDGMVFARFRLSPTGGLSANGPDKFGAAPVPQGEVEDYKKNVAKVGNLVWEDRDFDGVQDAPATEPGIDGVTVTLQWAGADNTIGGADDVTYLPLTTGSGTFNQGEYYYCGLIEGTYKVIYTSPANMTPTRANQGSQVDGGTLDADGVITGMDLTMAMETFNIVNVTGLPLAENGNGDNGTAPTGTFPDAQTDETHDMGFAFLDYGDLPESGNGDQFSTNMANNGAIHVVVPGFKLGASVDPERDGAPNANADGDDLANTGSADDEDGVSFVTPLIPGNNASISVVSMNPTGAAAVLQGWIDWNNNGLLDAAEALAFTSSVIPTGNATTTFTFPVPANAAFNDGMVFARFRLSPTGGLTANGPDKYGTTPVPQGEVEDYKKNVMCVGNMVWEDYDFDGQQDPTEPGIGGQTIQLVWGGPDGNTATTADNVTYTTTTLAAAAGGDIVGEYKFCGLIEGTYKIVALTPSDMTPTLSNTGSQVNGGFTDNDGIQTGTDLTMIMTDPFTITLASITAQPTNENGLGDNAPGLLGTFPDNQANESFDFGFVAIDFGDLPDTYVTDDTPDNSGAQHISQPEKYLGSCIDAERNANIDPAGTAGTWANGDDFSASTRTRGTCTVASDDENGIQFITPLVPGAQACVRVTYTALDVPGLVRSGNTFLSAWFDYNGDGDFTDAGEQAVIDLALATGTAVTRDVCFTVPNAATFTGGAARARFRIHCQPGLGSAGLAIGGEVEDYYIPVAKAGNYVWFDNDLRGDQTTTDVPKDFVTETGINGVDMVLIWGGLDGNLATTADNRVYPRRTMTGTNGENADGIYCYLGLIEGQYRVLPRKYAGVFLGAGIDSLVLSQPQNAVPIRKILTIANNAPATDFIDSDGTPSTTFGIPNLLASPTATLGVLNENGVGDIPTILNYPDRLTNESLDFGFIQEPNIELNMKIAGVEKGGQCGQFKVIVDLCVQNSGGADNGYVMAVPLNNIQASVPLQQQLGAAFIMTMGAPTIVNATWECGTAPLPQQLPNINAGFNGTTNTNLFDGTSGLLWPGEKVVVRYVFEVRPSNLPEPASLLLNFQANGSGKAVNYQGQPIPNYFQNGAPQYMAMDLSNEGLNFNGTYDDPDLSNYLGNCWKTTQSMAGNDLLYVSIDQNCEALINDQSVLEGEDPDCTDDQFCLGGYYKVTIKTQLGAPVPNPVPASYIGQTLIYEVENIVSCNKTWGQIKIEDKLAPVLVCEEISIPCNTPNVTPAYLANTLGIPQANPQVTDCQTFTLTYIDSEVPQNCASGLTKVITRKWTATDASGNTATCLQTINLVRPTLNDVTPPPDYDGIDAASFTCEDNLPIVNGHPKPTPDWIEAQGLQGYPYVFGEPGGCSINWEWHDFPIYVCDGTVKYRREWTIVDWCVGDGFVLNQILKVADEAGPDFVCPDNVTVSTDPFSCCATTNLPDVTVEDNCSRINNISGMITVRDAYTGQVVNMVTIGGTLQDFAGNNHWDLDTLANFGWTPCLPIGTHTVTYIAEDDCGNTASCNFNLTVRDLVPPVAACDETTTVAIGIDDPFDCYGPAGPNGVPGAQDACEFAGVTWVKATTFNDGSYDNCNAVKFSIRRMAPYSDCILGLNSVRGAAPCDAPNPSFPPIPSEFQRATDDQDSIKFYCCEVGTTQTIVLTVTQLNIDGTPAVYADGTPITNECMIQVEVQDKLKPACLPPAQVAVNCESFDPSLWAYGKATAADNCCLDTSKVYQGQCGLSHSVNYALFDTVCNRGTITRTFRVFDCHGASSSCTQRVIVTYDQDYFVKFPNDAIVTVCDGTGNYGEPTFFGEDCELLGVSFEDEVFTVVPDACFKIERTWNIINWCTYDPNGSCIYVPNPTPNAISNAPQNLPGPTVSACGTLPPWKSTIVKINPTDPLPGTDYCTFWDKNANCYKYKQIIKVIDGQAPTGTYTTPACDNQNWNTPNRGDLWNEMHWWDNGLQIHDLCEEPTDLCITGTDACSGSNVNIEYLLFLDLDNNGSMETVVNSVNTGIAGLGWNNVLYNNLNTPNFAGGTPRAFDERAVLANQKYGFAIQETINGTSKTACVRWNTQQQQNTYVTPELPNGTHKIKWFITDGCGNNKEYEDTFTVKDCKAPTVVCLNGLSTNIMPTGMIQLWASDFLQYTEDNCTPSGQIKIGIRKCGTGTGFPVDAFGNPITNVNFTCAELGTQCVELWAIDAAGNADYCETYVIIQDNNGNCATGDHINVAGAVKTEMTDGVEETTVNIDGTSSFTPPYSYFDLSDGNGVYEVMNNVPLASTFVIAPEKDDNPLNGVTTYDLVLISKHILGTEPFSSPYKMIAADANKSGSITTFDMVELRKLILGIYTELPNNTSWRFVDKSFVFPNMNNPFQTIFPETISVADAITNQMGEDFAGVKIGDVNNTAVANLQMQAEERTMGTAMFDLEDRTVKAGDVFEVNFKAAEELKGFQFTMLLDGLKAISTVNSENVNDGNFNLMPERAMAVSIDGAQDFTVKFRAEKAGKLSNMLGVSGSITRAEAYGKEGRKNIAFRYDGNTIAGVGFELYQNQPNPFVNKTSIGFFLPEATEATLSIFDETGRMVYQQKGQFAQGENMIALDRSLLNTTGVLYYKLETAKNAATRKMIQAN